MHHGSVAFGSGIGSFSALFFYAVDNGVLAFQARKAGVLDRGVLNARGDAEIPVLGDVLLPSHVMQGMIEFVGVPGREFLEQVKHAVARAKRKIQMHGVVEAALGLDTGDVLGQNREVPGDQFLLQKRGYAFGAGDEDPGFEHVGKEMTTKALRVTNDKSKDER
jgi:hypothetical protein